jgi:Lycopene cyclase
VRAIPNVDPSFRYVWLIWASAFLLPWAALFVAWPALRRPMLWASVLTAPFGLTEPLFVPKYWNPPSLFDLAHRTGFDIESLILCFAIGGLATAGYRVLAPASERLVAPQVRKSRIHSWHRAALTSPFLVFGVLLILPWNPIYPGTAALFAGALASGLCRPDLWRSMLVGGVVFLALYAIFLLGLKFLWPGYIEAVWNLSHLIAWRPAGLPLEELLFGFGFGMYWSSVYEHVAWRQRDVLGLPIHAGRRHAR